MSQTPGHRVAKREFYWNEGILRIPKNVIHLEVWDFYDTYNGKRVYRICFTTPDKDYQYDVPKHIYNAVQSQLKLLANQ